MAKKPTDVVKMFLEVAVKAESIPVLIAKLDPVEGHSEVQYIRDMAESLLSMMAEGAVMLNKEDVTLIEDSVGIRLENESAADTLLPLLSGGTGMQDGKHRVVVLIDPANYPAYEELARTQERTVDDLLQEVVDMVQENEWVYELHPRPKQILMTPEDAEAVSMLLGGSFSTGSELAKLIRDTLTPIEEAAGIFEEESSNVGAEGER